MLTLILTFVLLVGREEREYPPLVRMPFYLAYVAKQVFPRISF